jgi:methylglutaconyl-CoA hydratase
MLVEHLEGSLLLPGDAEIPSTILISEADGVRTIKLNRPDRRNALAPAMQTELTVALEEAAASPTTRVLVLTGAGSAFCGGLDLAVLKAMASQPAAELDADAHRLSKMFRTLYELPLPTIAAVNGHAIAGGTGLAICTDFTFAVPVANFGFTECKIGFVPALVSVYLSQQVSEKRMRDLLLTGRLFSATEAHAMGLIDDVVAPEALTDRVQALADTLLANSPTSLRATKALLTKQKSLWLDNALHHAMEANAKARQTPDFSEGVAAFLEKRKPDWES